MKNIIILNVLKKFFNALRNYESIFLIFIKLSVSHFSYYLHISFLIVRFT